MKVDVLVLAESMIKSYDILSELNGGKFRGYYEPVNSSSSLKFYSKLPTQGFTSIFDSARISVRLVEAPLMPSLILVAVHLLSKLHSDLDDQRMRVSELSDIITRAESQIGNSNTIVMGDLNMNPFEPPMVAADGLHGVMDAGIASSLERTVNGKTWRYFYNPMWSRMGDRNGAPSGTYYYNSGSALNFFWNTFDQILLRPNLLSYFDHERLLILDRIGDIELLKGRRIDKTYSDHLPIVLKLAPTGRVRDG